MERSFGCRRLMVYIQSQGILRMGYLLFYHSKAIRYLTLAMFCFILAAYIFYVSSILSFYLNRTILLCKVSVSPKVTLHL